MYTAETVQEFLTHLESNANHWCSAKRGDLAYRGQASSNWLLVPKAFRSSERLGYRKDSPLANPTSVVHQSRAEFSALQQFVQTANNSGLPITQTGGNLVVQNDPSQLFGDPDWEYLWPQNEILETLALAQHHGVPTRLLDFTEDALVAAYFAASAAWDTSERDVLPEIKGQYIAVWVVDLRFVRSLDAIGGRYPERIRVISVPKANNSYLHAQYGLFLVDRGANDVMTRGEILRGEVSPEELLSIDRVIADRASFWSRGGRLNGATYYPNLVRQDSCEASYTSFIPYKRTLERTK